jgi:hypothetical protein
VGRMAKPLKPTAARDLGRLGQPRQIANKAKAMPVSPFNTEPAPIGDPKAVTPPTRPSPATNGAFGFVQSIACRSKSLPMPWTRAGVRLIPEGRPANRSLSAIEPVSATAAALRLEAESGFTCRRRA